MLITQDGPSAKCYFYESILPNYISSAQPPTKKRPFCTLSSQPFSHTLDVLLPDGQAESLQRALQNGPGKLHYARVHMKLGEIVRGDFFNTYIKLGNILMLSEGRAGIDQVYSLSEGMLRLEVDKPTYERMGLDAKVIASEGRKHVKARYAVELNLRLPSMVKGKKGFERILWAFDNVLSHTVTWLFCDLKAVTDGSGPIGEHQPLVRAVKPVVSIMKSLVVPKFPEDIGERDCGAATEILEWLTLASSLSSRVESGDEVDIYLCRYKVLDVDAAQTEPTGQDLVLLHWHGFMPAIFITKVLLAALKATGDSWFAMTATSFRGEAYTVLRTDHRALTWEYAD